MGKRYREYSRPYPSYHYELCEKYDMNIKWHNVSKMRTNVRIDPLKRKDIWLTAINKIYTGDTAVKVLTRFSKPQYIINAHKTCRCGGELSTEHLIFECPYIKSFWSNTVNVYIGQIDLGLYITTAKSFLKYISKKYKLAHNITSMDTAEVDVNHASNMKTLAILEMLGSAIPPTLTTHYKRIESMEAAITAPNEHKVDQSVAHTLFASHYDKQVHTQFHAYLRPMLTNIPLHSYVYDNTQL